MILVGYIPQIVITETGINYKRFARIRRNLEAEGYVVARSSKRVRGSGMLIRSRPTKIEASVLMLLYAILGGKSIFHHRDMTVLREEPMIFIWRRAPK